MTRDIRYCLATGTGAIMRVTAGYVRHLNRIVSIADGLARSGAGASTPDPEGGGGRTAVHLPVKSSLIHTMGWLQGFPTVLSLN
jgi:hypothetical protein